MEIQENYQKVFDSVSVEKGFTAAEVEEIHSNLVDAMSTENWSDNAVLLGAFSWSLTAQGHTYWWNVENKILGVSE